MSESNTRKIVLPLAIIVVSVGIALLLVLARPEAQRRSPQPQVTSVEILDVVRSSYDVVIRSQGIVAAPNRSTLVPQVNGQIIEVSENFVAGGYFDKDEVLLVIDPRDYEIAVTVAEANVAQAQANLEQEQALAAVAEQEWRQLGRKPASSSLALRKPQQKAANAALKAAEAQLQRAQLDLERTQLRAPYAGRVLDRSVGPGQFVNVGTVLASLYAVDYLEIRLPVSQSELKYVGLADLLGGQSNTLQTSFPKVMLQFAEPGSPPVVGRIVRSEGTVDQSTRQLYLVARVDDPYGRLGEKHQSLRVGQFVAASISGIKLPDVFEIPTRALFEGKWLLLIDADMRLHKQPVNIVWRDEAVLVIDAGLDEGDRISLTPVAGVIKDRLVADINSPRKKQRNNGNKERNNGNKERNSGNTVKAPRRP